MEIINILNIFRDFVLPVAILLIFVIVLYQFFIREKKDHSRTRERLNNIYQRIEDRLFHELDELEKLLREERAKLK